MKKTNLFKILIVILVVALIICALLGIFWFSTTASKLLCGVLGLLGFGLAIAVYASCRAETLEMAKGLENTFLAAEQGGLPKDMDFYGESLTNKLCLKAVRLAETTHSKAKEQENSRAQLQATINDLAHQLRAPVANLTLYADTLAAGNLPEAKQAEFLAIIGGQARKLDFLVDALVKTGRLETGGIQMSPQATPLISTLKQAADLAKPLAEAKGLAFSLDCPSDLTLAHDQKWTAEAVFNLLDNAIKYTATGSITLTAQKWEIYTCIQVADTGPGFAPEEAALMFGRFYRASQTAAAPGIGLGLYITRQIAQLQGGYVQAKVLEEGSAFRLFLPNDSAKRGYQN